MTLFTQPTAVCRQAGWRVAALAVLLVGTTLAAQAQTLTCSATQALLSQVNAKAGTSLVQFDVPGGTSTSLGLVALDYNAIGFNVQDGFVYGFDPIGRILYRIDAEGQATSLGIPAGMPTGNFFAGTVDNNGVLYTFARNSGNFAAITDLGGTPTVTGTFRVRYTGLGVIPAVVDFAINPANGLLYGYDNQRGALASIDPATGTATLGVATTPTLDAIAGAWFDATGNFYVYRRSTGEIYQLDLGTGVGTLVGTSSQANDGDATSCPYTIGLTLATSQTDLTRGQTFTLTFEVTNPSDDTLTGASLDLGLPGGLTYVGGTLNTGAAGGSANAFGGTNALALTGLTLAPGTTTITIDVQVPLTEPFVSYDLQATLGALPGVLGPVDSDNPATASPVGDPTPVNIAFPAAGTIACTAQPLIARTVQQGTTLLQVDLSPFATTTLGSSAVAYNAIGYNLVDGYVYGLNPNTREMYRIDAFGATTALGVPAGMPVGEFYAATVDQAGTMYAYTRNRGGQLAVITGLAAGTPTVTAVRSVPGGPSVTDIALNPVDGLLYGYNNANSTMITIAPGTGAVNTVVTVAPTLDRVGGAWFDASGAFYLYRRNSGEVFQIDFGTGAATLIGTTLDGTEGDATSCPFSNNRIAGNATLAAAQAEMPEGFRVSDVYPNPFNPTASFRFAVAQSQRVHVVLYDVTGREVARPFAGSVEAMAEQTIQVDGRDLASGAYVLRVVGEHFAHTQRLTLLK